MTTHFNKPNNHPPKSSIPASQVHPLIGKFLAEVDRKNQLVTIRRFDTDLGNGLMLCTLICGVHGEVKDGQCIVHLADLTGANDGYEYEIYSSFENFSENYNIDKGGAPNISYLN